MATKSALRPLQSVQRTSTNAAAFQERATPSRKEQPPTALDTRPTACRVYANSIEVDENSLIGFFIQFALDPPQGFKDSLDRLGMPF